MMKTYNFCYALMALLIIGCDKSDGETEVVTDDNGVDSDYTLVLNESGMLSSMLLEADAKSVEISSENSSFEATSKPQLTFEKDGVLSMYKKKADCSGNIVVHDFENGTSKNYTVFDDLANCDLTTNAIAYNGTALYLAYEIEIATKQYKYFVRAVDVTENDPSFVDIEFEQQPVELAFAKNRLFVLTFNGHSEDYKLSVMDAGSLNVVHEIDLGLDVKRIFKNPQGDIIIGYPDLHTTLNSSTMAVVYTNYGESTEPNFFDSRFRHFDTTGKMYYGMPPGSNSIYPVVAAIYDFEKNNTVLYAFENFLTETQRNFEYKIESTTLVGYDEKNEILLIGYSKNDGSGKGGLLRIKIGPEPKLIDNLNLNGTPYALFVK